MARVIWCPQVPWHPGGQEARFLLFAPAGSSSPAPLGNAKWELLTSTTTDKEEEYGGDPAPSRQGGPAKGAANTRLTALAT